MSMHRKSYSAMFMGSDDLCDLLHAISFSWKEVLICVVQEMISQSFLVYIFVRDGNGALSSAKP